MDTGSYLFSSSVQHWGWRYCYKNWHIFFLKKRRIFDNFEKFIKCLTWCTWSRQIAKSVAQVVVFVLSQVEPLMLDIDQFLLSFEVSFGWCQVGPQHFFLKCPPFWSWIRFLSTFCKVQRQKVKIFSNFKSIFGIPQQVLDGKSQPLQN